jgi:hypothetical protein
VTGRSRSKGGLHLLAHELACPAHHRIDDWKSAVRQQKENTMQAKKSILSLAIVGLFAAAGAALAYGGPGPQGGGMRMGGPPADAAQHAERMQARLGALKEALKLQPNQMDAWNAYEAKVKSEGQARFQMRQAMQQQTDAQALADQRVAMMKQRAQSAEEINGLRKALVATLSPEQKTTFEQHSMGPRMSRGPGAEGGKPGGMGPGYGPGPGGRGPGYGRS